MFIGGVKNQPTTMTPELKALLNAGLKQVNAIGGLYTVQNTTEVVVIKYTTQVVSGTLSTLLMEVKELSSSKLVSTDIWDQPWTGKIHQLQKACIYTSQTGSIYGNECGTAEECQTLLIKSGNCQDLQN